MPEAPAADGEEDPLTRYVHKAVLALMGAGVLAVGAPVPAGATAPANGCPRGYLVLSVADLTGQGYRVPAQVDDPASGISSFGRPGNGDGLVCAVALGNQRTPWGGQIYNFWDNTLLS